MEIGGDPYSIPNNRTTMIRIKDLQEGMRHLVGWQQDWTDDKAVPQDLMESESGLYYQAAHSLLTIDNIKSAMPKINTDYEPYDSEKYYYVGDKMKWHDKAWKCMKDCKGINPDNSDWNEDYNDDFGSLFWEEYSPMREYLTRAVDNGVAAVANEFVTRKTLEQSSKSLFEHKCLFDTVGRIRNRITNTHNLVGYEIQPLKGAGVTTQIHKIGLQMNGGNGVVRIYLFHSSQSKPIKVFNLRVLKNSGYQWFPLQDCFLPYMGEHGVGGAWYLCYNQDDLPMDMEAVNISKDWSKEPCRGCNVGSIEDWRVMTKYIRVSPFRAYVDRDFAKNPTMFDNADIEYTPQRCYGMNCEISIGCDLTDFMLSQKGMFASVLQKQVAYNMLRDIAYNPYVNVNRNQNNVARQDIVMELDGNTYTRSGGIRSELKKAYDALELDTEGMDSACMACKRKGVRYTIA